jgi:hypothetical protein
MLAEHASGYAAAQHGDRILLAAGGMAESEKPNRRTTSLWHCNVEPRDGAG